MNEMTAGEAAEILEALPNNSDEYKQYVEVNPNYILVSPYCLRAFKVAAAILRRVASGELAEVKHAHWVYKNNGWRCSNCENLADFWSMSAAQHLGTSCPYCNALMDKSDMRQTQDGKDDSHETD